MLFLYDYIVAIQVAVVACVFAWLFGGTMAGVMTPVMPWLVLVLVEVMLCFPQRYAYETTYDARERVWSDLKADPMTWVTLGFFGLLLIPFVNKGLCPVCDYAAINLGGADPRPPIPFVPFCVNRVQHLTVVMWFVPALTAMLAVKHSLLRRGKRMVLELVVWNGVALALVGFLQQITGAEGPLWIGSDGQHPYFFSTFGYANMGGDYFTTLFGLSVGLWRWKVETVRKQTSGSGDGDAAPLTSHALFWKKHLMLVPAGIFFFSALTTLSRAAIIFVSLMAVMFFVHAFVSFFKRLPRIHRVKASAVSVVVLILIAVSLVYFLPGDLQREVDSLSTTTVLNRVSGKNAYPTRVATDIWTKNLLFGCGGWGYIHFSVQEMTDQELKSLRAWYGNDGTSNVHNDSLQFLAEHGLVGFSCLVALVVLLVWPLGRVWKALISVVQFTPTRDQPPRPVAFFALPAPVFCILVTAVATVVHSFADCPFRSPAVLTLFFVSLAAMEGFLPRLKER